VTCYVHIKSDRERSVGHLKIGMRLSSRRSNYMETAKRKVYFNEYNVLMSNTAYLPFVSGLLCAYAKRHKKITEVYDFLPFLFYRDKPELILEKYESPSIAAFSVSMWNEQLNLHIAEKVKQRYPECLIVFGGPQVPFDAQRYFDKHWFIDISVRGEGEITFTEILERAIDSEDFSGIAGISWRDNKTRHYVKNAEERLSPKDMDTFPSPYLDGVYEYLFKENNGLNFQAIVETNRGCPFNCSFCFWGQGGLSTKWRFHSLERFRSEIEWCGKHQIRYVFNADSNFGMHKRDYDIAACLVKTKTQYGYPEKFRTCFGKNTNKRIFEIGKLLHENDLEKSVTLSRQTNCEQALENVGRKNIKMSNFNDLQILFNEYGIPVYSEMILGLPGESYESWTKGIEQHLRSGLKNQLFVYLCEVYPNTELAEPAYQQKFGIVTRKIVLTEIHSSARKRSEIQEYQDIIVATKSMPIEDWRNSAKFAWLTMLLYSMKLGFFILKYLVDRYDLSYTDLIRYICELQIPSDTDSVFQQELEHFENHLDNLLKGKGRGQVIAKYGPLYWDVEEAAFLRVTEKLDKFYEDFSEIVKRFLIEKAISYDENELSEVIKYQNMRVPSQTGTGVMEYAFSSNLPEYFEHCLRSKPKHLKKEQQLLKLSPKDFGNDRIRYAREVVIWGRKSDKILVESSYQEK
jgi:radical SAM superfamily enzyme YgiQ (UPF0313 family)